MDGIKCTFICIDARPCPTPIPRARWWPGVGGRGEKTQQGTSWRVPPPHPLLGFSRPGGSGLSSSLLPGLMVSSSPLPQPAVTGLVVN